MTDDTALATKADITGLMEHIDGSIKSLYDATERWKDEMLSANKGWKDEILSATELWKDDILSATERRKDEILYANEGWNDEILYANKGWKDEIIRHFTSSQRTSTTTSLGRTATRLNCSKTVKPSMSGASRSWNVAQG